MAIGINLLLLLLLHKHQQHHLVNTTTTSSTSSSCSSSSSTNSSKSSSSTTHSSSSSTTDSSTSSSTTTISTSSHHQWPNPPRRVPSGCPPWLRARPAPKKKKGRCVERLDWHIDTRKKLKAGCLLSCTRVQRRFSYLLSLSSSNSKPLPLSSPNEDSSPEPILSESRGPDQHLPLWFTRKAYAKKYLGKNRQEALSDLLSSSDNSKTSDGNPWLSWYGWTLLLIAQQLNAITTRSDHGLMRKWRQKFIRTGMRIHVCKNIEGLKKVTLTERQTCFLNVNLLLSRLGVWAGQARDQCVLEPLVNSQPDCCQGFGRAKPAISVATPPPPPAPSLVGLTPSARQWALRFRID